MNLYELKKIFIYNINYIDYIFYKFWLRIIILYYIYKLLSFQRYHSLLIQKPEEGHSLFRPQTLSMGDVIHPCIWYRSREWHECSQPAPFLAPTPPWSLETRAQVFRHSIVFQNIRGEYSSPLYCSWVINRKTEYLGIFSQMLLELWEKIVVKMWSLLNFPYM